MCVCVCVCGQQCLKRFLVAKFWGMLSSLICLEMLPIWYILPKTFTNVHVHLVIKELLI